MKKIEIGHTNHSYRKDNNFYQIKVSDGFNHKIDYKSLNKFDFVPKLINENVEANTWEWIEGNHLLEPSKSDLEQLAKILKTIHNSNLDFPKNNIRQRIEKYRKIYNQKNINIPIMEKLYRKINLILKNMDKTTPVHGDLWQYNILKTKENKIFIIDWEYAHKGDIHYELAYFIESYELNKEDEKFFLNAYSDYQQSILKKHKVLVNYLTILWLYSNEKLFFSPENCIKKLKKYYQEGF